MVKDITIEELLKKGVDILKEGDFLNPFLDVQLLLCYTLNVDKVHIYTHKKDLVDKESVDKFLNLVYKRKEGYPLQYILGKQEFMGIDFYVEEGVLVPRPDTEVLVEKVIDIVKHKYKDKKVVNVIDIGTGSGAITLSLAYYLKNTFIYSIDISDKALYVANKNCNRLNLQDRVKFLKGNLLEPLSDLKLFNSIDIIVSNPPYIPSREIDSLQKEVSRYEPRLALDGGEDGLDYYRQIVSQSLKYLTEEGILAFEIGFDQGMAVKEIIERSGQFENVEIIKDLAGHDRVVVGFKKQL